MKRIARIAARNAGERATIEATAKAEGLSVSEYVRALATRGQRQPVKPAAGDRPRVSPETTRRLEEF
jgi:hypothetical protein